MTVNDEPARSDTTILVTRPLLVLIVLTFMLLGYGGGVALGYLLWSHQQWSTYSYQLG